MRVVIAAELGPNKLGSLECQIFSTGQLMEKEGAAASYLFSGDISAPVRQHFGLREDQVVPELGTLANPGSHGHWISQFKRLQPEVIWLHLFPPFSPLLRQIRSACPRARIYFTDHVSRGFPRRNPVKAVLCRARAATFQSVVDRYIAVSRFVANRLRDVDYIPEDRIDMVYNGVDLQRFRLQEGRGSFIAAVCHMRPQKGVHVLLQALAILKQRGEEPDCRLVGVGPHLEEYQSYAHEQGLRNVTFLGSRDDVPDILRGARMVIVPSTWDEAFGLAAAEALAVGRPVIASNIGALPEVVVDQQNGVLVPSGDAEALAGAMASLFRDADQCEAMGRAGRARVEQLFDLERQAKEIVRIMTA